MTRPTETELYHLFDRSPIGMYRSAPDGAILYCNGAFAKMLGYTLDQAQKLNVVRDLYVDADQRRRLVAQFGAMGMLDGATVQWRHRDGRILTIRLYGHIVENVAGASYDASVMDITDANRQREELERTAATLDVVVKQVSAIWWLVDHDLRILRVGGPTLEVLGYPPDTFVGTTIYQVVDSDPTATEGSRSLAAHKRALGGEIVRFQSDYRGRTLENTIAPFRIDGTIIYAIGTAIDVTAVRALEQRMVDAQRAESLGVLAGGLAHDFNNLLVAILGNADLALRDVGPGAPGRAALENIRNASLRAAELTDQLLAYAGRGTVASERVPPKPLVDELLRITASQLANNITIDVDIPATLALRGEPAQIRQVVMNLITNARDALGDRGGTIKIGASNLTLDGSPDPDDVVTASAGTYVSIEVTDDGPGMDHETRRRIFDPFFTTKPTGHGLGLAAALGIVRAHGGGLRVRSGKGLGATFQVILPASTTLDQRPPLDAPTRTVLVVDDEDLVRDVVTRMIEDLGYAAVAAADGPAALALLATTTFDAALVDLTMPKMSGADLVVHLRQTSPQTKIVLCTGFDRDRRGPVAADAYLPKPFRMEALEATLAKILT